MTKFASVLLLLVLLMSAASAQSVADTARAGQTEPHKKAAKVYTNDDLAGSDQKTETHRKKTGSSAPEGLSADAKQMRSKILKQKAELSKLDSHIKKLEAIQAEQASAKLTPQVTAETCAAEPERCETRRQVFLDLARSKRQREDAQKKLDSLQDEARKKGYDPPVFDPD